MDLKYAPPKHRKVFIDENGQIKSLTGEVIATIKPTGHRGSGRPSPKRPKNQPSQPLAADKNILRLVPLGGVEEIGKNITAVEYNGSIVVIDMGLQFPDEETPGVDYIVPDASWLEKRKRQIKAVFITHGHLDHIGGIPYLMPKIGNPVIYTRALTSLLIKKRQEEFPHVSPLHLE